MNTSTKQKIAFAASLVLFSAAQLACRSNEPALAAPQSPAASPIIALTPSMAPAVSPVMAPAPSTHSAATSPDAVPNEALTLPDGFRLDHVVTGTFQKALPVVVVVDKKKHLTHVFQYQSTGITEVLAVQNCTGKRSTPTPEGRCVIMSKQMDPTWKPPVSIDPRQKVVAPWSKTHKNPLGVAFLGLSIDHGMVGLHGTNCPKQIGMSASHGCIRHRNADILKLAKLVRVGTPVYIVHSMPTAKISSKDMLPTGLSRAIYISHTL